MSDVEAAIARVHREEWTRIVAGLARRFRDLDIAEDAAGEAFAVALERWRSDGVPPNPGAWLTQTAARRAIDRLRREALRDDKHRQALMIVDDTPPDPTGPVDDDRLRLVFTCCHPALAPEARIALTLRLVAGLTVAEIARAFLVPEPTLARRITRAKGKIRDAHIPFRVPSAADVRARLAGVLTVVFLVFNEGYLASGGGAPVRAELSDEAIRLARLLRELLPDDFDVAGLLALLLLTEARRPSRFDADGELVTLHEQDRARWRSDLIAEGHALVRACITVREREGTEPGRYELLAAINAVHTAASRAADTDWTQIVANYDRLVRIDPSPVVALNRAVAVAELDGADVGLALVDRLPLEEYHAWHAARGELLARVGRLDDARRAFESAIERTANTAERAHLARRRDALPR